MDDSKKFIANFRNARNNPLASSSPASLITRGDIVKRNRAIREAKSNFLKDLERYRQEETKDAVESSQQLRDAVKQTSGGRIIVDKSIYDKAQLENFLNAVNEMSNFNGGVLFPGYTNISDGDPTDYGFGETAVGLFLDGNSGTKNDPYKIIIREANDSPLHNLIAKRAKDSGWWTKTGDRDESSTPTHELSHSAQQEAVKKTKDPALTLNYAEKKKRQDFRDRHASLQEAFEVAAKNLGYNGLAYLTALNPDAMPSGYARQDADDDWSYVNARGKEWKPYTAFPEVFAEAYTDVLYNKDKAKPYSKELIKQYVDYINDYNSTFNGITQEMGILPTKDSDFINNWRELYFGKKK